jgi:hypothetical protein
LGKNSLCDGRVRTFTLEKDYVKYNNHKYDLMCGTLRRSLQAKTRKGTVKMLSCFITTSLYGRREFWIAEARDMKRRIIERVSRSLK